MISAKKRELEAAKKEKKAQAEEQEKLEEQRLAMQAVQAEAAETAARPVVALSGVPRALLGGNINSVPAFDNRRQGTGSANNQSGGGRPQKNKCSNQGLPSFT